MNTSQQTVLFLIGVCLWYSSSVMVNVHWKSTFKEYGLTESTTSQRYHYAMFFTTIQFAAGAMTSFILIVCSGKLENLMSLATVWRKGVVIGGLFYLGQLSTNMSLSMTSVTLTHMVKTLEPLLALLWALTILKNKISGASIIHMLIMLVGVLLTSYTEVSFSFIGVTFALVSNISLSLRNLFIKLSNGNAMLSGLQLFFVSCFFGAWYSASLYLFNKQLSITEEYYILTSESIRMGMYFSGQHIMSYLLLSSITITSHALLNCLKRALIIFISAVVLGIQLPPVQILGIVITIIGSILYAIEVLKKPKAGKPEEERVFSFDYTFSKPFKLILLLPVTLLLCITVIDTNQNDNYLPQYSVQDHATAVWAFDAPITRKSLELVNSKFDPSIINLKIFCANVEKCQNSVSGINSELLSIQIIQLKAFELSSNTQVAAWMASHPINKIKSLTCFPAYFHKMMYLSALWKYGGIVIDMALNVKENSDINDFITSSSFEGCLLDQSKSSAIICNLLPEHKYTEMLMGEVSKLFMKSPKSCTFDSALPDRNNLTKTVSSNIGYDIPSAEIKFGLLAYGATHNLGDEMQSIAAAHAVPHIYTFMNRQTFTNPDKTSLTYIGNAWWDGNGILFKDIPNLKTVPVAVHINPSAYGRITSSKSLLTAMAPIGARDLVTYEKLIKEGIDSIFTGCITLWMKNPDLCTSSIKRNNQTIIVDIKWKGNPIPTTLSNVKYMSHKWGASGVNAQVSHFSHEEKFINAYENLMQYAQARLVVTSRIHVALPCVAMGTPVIFLNSKQIWDAGKNPPSRVMGLVDLFHTVDMWKMNDTTASEYLKTFNWDSPPPNPNPEKVNVLKREARRILERVPELAVSLKVLELI
ncbi:unnamed protein product [Meganyctiphanes norvegica]|uniref:Sugar phosphate transporter domain-containing protein n=1 Tax=Meganyctiphanes norvegica TaxID=48144 RepID=A0AAV2PRU3_MEGNR